MSTSWDLVTAENKDTIAEKLEELQTAASATVIKKKRGRPPKPVTPVETVPLPQPPSREEQEIPSSVLASMFSKSPNNSGSSTPRKSALKFSEPVFTAPPENEEKELMEKIDKEILLELYEGFFREPLSQRHSKKKKNFDETTEKSILEKEIKEIQRAVGRGDPARDLGKLWAGTMHGLESMCVYNGVNVTGLGSLSEKMAVTPEYNDTFRELLIKYPSMRKYIALGGFPELKLAWNTMILVQTVYGVNMKKETEAINIPRPTRV